MTAIKYIAIAVIALAAISVFAFEKIIAWVDKISEREENADAD